MAVKIRLQRGGKKRKPIYSIVIADARAKRDGKFIEKLGTFNPNIELNQVTLNFDSALAWYMKGAVPTETVRTLLSNEGVLLKKHLQVGVNKGVISQEDADKKFSVWLEEKGKKDSSVLNAAQEAQEAKLKAQADERVKIKEDMEAASKAEAAAIIAAEEAAKAVAEAAVAAEAAPEEAPAAEETPAAEEKPAE